MRKLKFVIKAFALVFIVTGANAQQQPETKRLRTLIVFFDGLRPDYITPEGMPNLYAFQQKSAWAKEHHSIYPTVTRLNSAAYATGSYPAKSGILSNKVYFPQVDRVKPLNTADARQMQRVDSATNGQLLTNVTLGETLAAAGKTFTVFSSGSSGQAFLQNPRLKGGPIVNSDMILPESYKETVFKAVGPFPTSDVHGEKHTWAVNALLKLGLVADGPDVSAIWLSDPDHTTHADGIGVPSAVAAIKSVDDDFGKILNHIKSNNLEDSYNIIISADHGFITNVGKKTLTAFLIEKGFKASRTSTDIVVADGGLYIKDRNPETVKKIVSALQEASWVGAIFTKGEKPGDMKGWVDGTISYEAIHWNHPIRSADILVDVNWNDTKNKHGYPGTGYATGPAGHGSFSPYEVHINLMASGPSFKKSFQSELPTANIDITPTVLHINNVPVPEVMDGRVAYELLTEKAPSSAPTKAKKEYVKTSVKLADGSTYNLTLERTVLGKYKYNDFVRTERISNKAEKSKKK